MNRKEILSRLVENHKVFIEYMQSLPEEDFTYSLNDEKWTAGQEMKHIIWSVDKLANALLLPKFVMKIKFGTANRPSRTYDVQINKLKTGLEAIGDSYRIELEPVPYEKRATQINKLEKSIALLCHRARKYSEANLDYYILPHPLMGKMTIRELLYFTTYHVLHYKENSIRNLKGLHEL